VCGRFTLFSPKEQIEATFKLPFSPTISYSPRWNISPGQTSLVALSNKTNIIEAIWGLKTSALAKYKPINIRVETIKQNNFYSKLAKTNRIAVIANGYYEWQSLEAKNKQPWYFFSESETLVGLAGIYAIDANNPNTITFAILTTEAQAKFQSIHNRQPVILSPQESIEWLISPDIKIKELITNSYRLKLNAYRVSTLVNKSKIDLPQLINSID
jgi:putative SOS response-associated peptidase YedK